MHEQHGPKPKTTMHEQHGPQQKTTMDEQHAPQPRTTIDEQHGPQLGLCCSSIVVFGWVRVAHLL
jgi:hypothetical protein